MDKPLKQRMVGAIVLIALAVIFIPMLLDGGSERDGRTVSLEIPAKPDQEYRSRLLPLDESDQSREADTEPPDAGQVRRAPDPGVTAEPRLAESDEPAASSERASGGEETASAVEPERPAAPESESPPAPDEARDAALANWFVQVGSFSSETNATELRERLSAAGHSAFVESSTVDGETKHRVKVGPEMDRARAEKVRDRIAEQHDLTGIVISEP